MFKVKHTIKIEGDVTIEVFTEVYKTANECKARIEAELEKTYGDEWKELHGNDLTHDENGNPYYFFDMEEDDFEQYEVVAA